MQEFLKSERVVAIDIGVVGVGVGMGVLFQEQTHLRGCQDPDPHAPEDEPARQVHSGAGAET